MNIQYINNYSTEEFKRSFESHNFTFNSFSKPFSLDDFDINIIDLNNIWYNEISEKITDINILNDLDSLKVMMSHSKKSRFLLICPYNQEFIYTETEFLQEKCTHKIMLKNIIHEFVDIVKFLLPDDASIDIDLNFERTKTYINDTQAFDADFYFNKYPNFLTKSTSDKITTIKLTSTADFYVTTLNFYFKSAFLEKNIINFLKKIELIKNENPVPEWIFSEILFDDAEQMKKITSQKAIISNAKLEIEKSQEILSKNLYYKSILYSNGNELVKVVFEILENILDCDLSNFNDEKHEDFLIKKSNITFVGEIKGINGSVKNANISQLDVHYNGYLDKLQEENKSENVKALLIINPNRSRPIKEREQIHQNQLNLAIRNGSLIIQTYDLLKIFEAFKQNKISSEEIEDIFTDKIGILDYKKILND